MRKNIKKYTKSVLLVEFVDDFDFYKDTTKTIILENSSVVVIIQNLGLFREFVRQKFVVQQFLYDLSRACDFHQTCNLQSF